MTTQFLPDSQPPQQQPSLPGTAPQPSQSGNGNPFTDVLNHVSAFNNALTGQGQLQSQTQPQQISGDTLVRATPPPLGTQLPYSDQFQNINPFTGQPFSGSGSAAPLSQATAPPPDGGTGGAGAGGTGTGGAGAGTGTGTGTGGSGTNPWVPPPTDPNAPPPKPAGYTGSDWSWQMAWNWGKTPGYGYLQSQPGVVDAYAQWASAHPGSQNVDVVDWLQNQGYASPQAGRRGYDTYKVTGPGGAATPWANESVWGQPPPTGTYPAPPPDQTPPPTPPPGTLPTPPPPNVPPPPGTPPTPVTTPPPAVTPPALQPPPDSEIQKLLDQFQQGVHQNQPDVESMMNPMFARQRQLLQQQLQSQAALTPGRTQSGGFGQNEGQALADLGGQQSATLAGALQAQSLAQMQQNTALTGLATQAGMQKYVADVNADLTKFQVKTNADLQAWITGQDNVFKKYGIDANTFLQEYQAQLQLAGVQYSADASIDVAAIHAAMTRLGIEAQLQLGTAGLNVTRENNIGQFILGLIQSGNIDINQLNQILAGLPGGTTVVRP